MRDYVLDYKVLRAKLLRKYGEDFKCYTHIGKETFYSYKRQHLFLSCRDSMIDPEAIGKDQENLIVGAALNILQRKILNKHYKTALYNSLGKFLDTVISDIPEELLDFLIQLIDHDEKKT